MDPNSEQEDVCDEAELDIRRDQPGLRESREVVANRLEKQMPHRRDLRRDGVAGLTTAINNVPDGMANGLLVGVNPVYGLYATMVGPITGGIFSSTGLSCSMSMVTSLMPESAPSSGNCSLLKAPRTRS